MKRICVVTGSRAEYGLLRWTMEGIRQSAHLELQVIATGAHLSPDFGLTYRDIEAEGFRIDRKVDMLLTSDSPAAVTKSMGLALIGLADALAELRPDLVFVLGDRYESFVAATAALVAGVPVAHAHGGETTEGAFDEAFRHSITKMAHLHFVAADEYRRRVIQLGEDPDSVFVVGGLGVENIHRLELLDRSALEKALDFRLGRKNLLVTFHPVTLEPGTAVAQMRELLGALEGLEDTNVVFTMPNADTEGRSLFPLIEDFVGRYPQQAKAFKSLGQVRYLSLVAQVDAVVGNSSSGIAEVPSFRKPTVNIGDRQRGRLRAGSVVDCEPTRQGILEALRKAESPVFQASLASVENPYGFGNASETIVRALEQTSFDGLLKKRFFDLVVQEPPLPSSRTPGEDVDHG